MSVDLATWLASLQPGSLGGERIHVLREEQGGSFSSVEDVVIGTGTRMRPIVAGPDVFTVEAVLNQNTVLETSVLERKAVLTSLLQRQLFDSPVEYISPWRGLVHVVVDPWSFRHRSEDVEFIEFGFTATSATLPEAPASAPRLTTIEALLSLAEVLGAGFAGEPIASAELLAVSGLLGVPVGLPPEKAAAQTTRKLAEPNTLRATGVPAAIKATGDTARNATLGELTPGSFERATADILVAAMDADSKTLGEIRTAWLLFLGVAGVSAFGPRDTSPGRRLQEFGDLDRLSRLNRDAVRLWVTQLEGVRL